MAKETMTPGSAAAQQPPASSQGSPAGQQPPLPQGIRLSDERGARPHHREYDAEPGQGAGTKRSERTGKGASEVGYGRPGSPGDSSGPPANDPQLCREQQRADCAESPDEAVG